jgi:hypothetical protein
MLTILLPFDLPDRKNSVSVSVLYLPGPEVVAWYKLLLAGNFRPTDHHSILKKANITLEYDDDDDDDDGHDEDKDEDEDEEDQFYERDP